MKTILQKLPRLFLVLFLIFFGHLLSGQTTALFEEDEILQISLTGEMKQLLKDNSEKPQYYPLEMSYGANYDQSLSVQVKTRGNFRRLLGNCSYLPLMIKFIPSPEFDQSTFRAQRTLKLVMPCSNERYLVREWLTYKLYNLISPNSFKVRMVRVRLVPDHKKGKVEEALGFFLEEEKQLGDRLEMTRVKSIVLPQDLDKDHYLRMTMFQYLIGNTDWSVKYRQNIKVFFNQILDEKIAVPYDFDFSGFVNSPYAKPPSALELRSIRDRRYRGYCIENLKEYDAVLAHYNALKPEIYNLIRNCELLDDKDLKSIIKFVDRFYENVNNGKRIRKDLLYPCNPFGTGNIDISGLKN